MTGFLLHPAAALHDPGWGHPEHQGRLRALASAVSKDMLTLHGRVLQMEPRSATEDGPAAGPHPGPSGQGPGGRRPRHGGGTVHPHGFGYPRFRGFLGCRRREVRGPCWPPWMAWPRASYETPSSLPARRVTMPPPPRAMGFCLFNHVAVAARYVQDQGLGDGS